MSLSSVWSGHPEISELIVTHPVLYRAAAARAPSDAAHRQQAAPTAGIADVHHRSHQRHRRRSRVLQFARPAGEPYQRHQCRGDLGPRPQDQTDRHRALRRARRPSSTSRRPRRRRRSSGRPSRSISPSKCPTAERAALGQGRGPAQRSGRDDQRPVRHARRWRFQRLGLGRHRQQAAGESRSRLPAARHSGSKSQGTSASRAGAMRRSTSRGSTMSTRR